VLLWLFNLILKTNTLVYPILEYLKVHFSAGQQLVQYPMIWWTRTWPNSILSHSILSKFESIIQLKIQIFNNFKTFNILSNFLKHRVANISLF
jgi:hypothetical protein